MLRTLLKNGGKTLKNIGVKKSDKLRSLQPQLRMMHLSGGKIQRNTGRKRLVR